MWRRSFLTGMASMSGFALWADEMHGSSEGFYVPSEEHKHQRCFMQWPCSRKVYRDAAFLEETQKTIANIANTIAAFEPVTLLAAQDQHGLARSLLSENVSLWDIPTEDLWCRDAGPIFAINDQKKMAVMNIQFNGWGKKQTHSRDGAISMKIANRLELPFLETGLRGEAGGVEQNGHGMLIAHEGSWVNRNRNPGLSKDQVATKLLRAYGADRLIWAKGVKGEDITDYHIDALVRFTGAEQLLINLPQKPDRRDPFHKAALETLAILEEYDFGIEIIPEPSRPRVKSQDFVASYANFYIANDAVIAAEFGDPETDALAQDALARHFPDRDIIALNVDALGLLGGGIHCATQQMPYM